MNFWVRLYAVFFFTLLCGNAGMLRAQNTNVLTGEYLRANLGYKQMNAGFMYAGLKYMRWRQELFTSHNLNYGYSLWKELHGIEYQTDLTLYSVNMGMSMAMYTKEKSFTPVFRPHVGVFFVFFGANFGPNLWLNNNHSELLNRWVFQLELVLPLCKLRQKK